MKVNKLVCITGLPGSGKSIVSDYLVNKGFQLMRFGQVVLDEIKRKKLKANEINERKIREGLRSKHGMAAMAILNLPRIKDLINNGSVVGDGLYSFEEYKVLKENFKDNLIVIAIYAPPYLRYQRLAKRITSKLDTDFRYRPFTKKEAVSRDYAELENLNKGATIAMADFTIANTKNIKALIHEIDQVIAEVNA